MSGATLALSVLDTQAVIARRGLWDESGWTSETMSHYERSSVFMSGLNNDSDSRTSHCAEPLKIRLNEPRISRMNPTVAQSVCLRARDSQLNGHIEFRGNGEFMFGCQGRLRAVDRKIFWAEKFGQSRRSVLQTTSPNIPHSSATHFSALKFFCPNPTSGIG